jgi:Tfp pilus assembly pilus retraction ATPase PilT
MDISATGITRLKQLAFTELYLGHVALGDRMGDGHGAVEPLPDNEGVLQDVETLKSVCRQATPATREFKVVHDDVAYRVFMLDTSRGDMLVLRKMSDEMGTLADIGLPPACVSHVLAPDLRGLFVVSGAARSGKSTTAGMLVQERLARFGGVAVTAADHTELPLEGKHGAGICYQTRELHSRGDYAAAFNRIASWGPSIIFVGEIADRATAVLALQTAANGRLVVGTLRCDSLLKAVMKLNALVNEDLVAGGAQLVADGLGGVLHQRLHGPGRPGVTAQLLSLQHAPQARRHILESQYDQLAAEIERQSAALRQRAELRCTT